MFLSLIYILLNKSFFVDSPPTLLPSCCCLNNYFSYKNYLKYRFIVEKLPSLLHFLEESEQNPESFVSSNEKDNKKLHTNIKFCNQKIKEKEINYRKQCYFFFHHIETYFLLVLPNMFIGIRRRG